MSKDIPCCTCSKDPATCESKIVKEIEVLLSSSIGNKSSKWGLEENKQKILSFLHSFKNCQFYSAKN